MHGLRNKVSDWGGRSVSTIKFHLEDHSIVRALLYQEIHGPRDKLSDWDLRFRFESSSWQKKFKSFGSWTSHKRWEDVHGSGSGVATGQSHFPSVSLRPPILPCGEDEIGVHIKRMDSAFYIVVLYTVSNNLCLPPLLSRGNLTFTFFVSDERPRGRVLKSTDSCY